MSRAQALHEVWSIAWPTVLTMTSYTAMQFVDGLMVGQVGPLEVAAQGNAGIWVFAPLSIAMGFLTVVNTYVSQNLGAGRPEAGAKYAWAALWISAIVAVTVLLPFAAALPFLFERIHDPGDVPEHARLVGLEVGYGRILLAGGFLTLAARAMHHYFFGLHRPRLITVSAILGNTTNVVANYVLIFGADGIPALGIPGVPGMPALGLPGAAIGTLIGSAVEVAIPFVVFVGPLHRELRTRDAWRPSLGPVRDLARLGWPAAVQYGNEIVCWALFMTVLVGTFGAEHMAAGWIALKYMHLSFMPAVGFSVAVTSLVGRYVGAGAPDVGVDRARLGLAMAVGYMTVCAVVFVVFRRPLVAVFIGGEAAASGAGDAIVEIGAKLLICAAVFQTVDAFGIVYTGALRGAGDTVWPGVVTMIYSWLFIVGGGYVFIWLLPGLESLGPWIAAAAYIIIFGATMAVRFERGAWRSIRLVAPAGGGTVGPGPPAAEAEAAVRDIAVEIAEVGPMTAAEGLPARGSSAEPPPPP